MKFNLNFTTFQDSQDISLVLSCANQAGGVEVEDVGEKPPRTGILGYVNCVHSHNVVRVTGA